jgi:hypothetical protein
MTTAGGGTQKSAAGRYGEANGSYTSVRKLGNCSDNTIASHSGHGYIVFVLYLRFSVFV